MWTKDHIKELLLRNDRAVERALVVLFQRQTADEQMQADTKHHNNRGFTQSDARWMTQLAKQVMKGERLRPYQLSKLRTGRSTRYPSRIGKYARQLAEAANETLAAIDRQIASWEATKLQAEMSEGFVANQKIKEANRELHLLEERRKKLLPKTETLQQSA